MSALIIAGMLSLASASAQQLPPQLPLPRISVLPSPNYFAPVSTSASRCGASGGVTISVSAEATLPSSATDTRIPFEVLEGNNVLASGQADVARIRRPNGPAPQPRVVIRASFQRTGMGGEGQVRVRLSGTTRSESAPASYSWSCITEQRTPGLTAPTIPLPDLAFDTRIMTVQMTRDRRDPIELRSYAGRQPDLYSDAHTVEPNAHVQFWDRTMCRGFDSAWAEIRVEFMLTNNGLGDLPSTFQIEGRVRDAPAWPNPRSVEWPHSPTATRMLERLQGVRASTGRQSTIYFEELQSRFYFARGAGAGFDRFEVIIPCGRGRRIEIILDPNNLIRESDETNNTIFLYYDLLG